MNDSTHQKSAELAKDLEDRLSGKAKSLGFGITPLPVDDFPTAEKNKKDLSQLCGCGIKAPVHTIGFHEAVIKSTAVDW